MELISIKANLPVRSKPAALHGPDSAPGVHQAGALFQQEVAEGPCCWRKFLAAQMGDVPVTLPRQALNVHQRHMPAGQLMAHGAQRQETQAHACHHRLLDGLVAGHFHYLVQWRLVGGKKPLHGGAGARALLSHHKGLVSQAMRAPSITPGWREQLGVSA